MTRGRRSGHVDLAGAEQRHAVEADAPRRERRELGVEVARRGEDAADELLDRRARCASISSRISSSVPRGSPRRCCARRWSRRAPRTAARITRGSLPSCGGAQPLPPRRRRAARCAPGASAPSASGPKRTRVQLDDGMADGLAHPPHLALAALAQLELDHVAGRPAAPAPARSGRRRAPRRRAARASAAGPGRPPATRAR